jgi:hypothetical protein
MEAQKSTGIIFKKAIGRPPKVNQRVMVKLGKSMCGETNRKYPKAFQVQMLYSWSREKLKHEPYKLNLTGSNSTL